MAVYEYLVKGNITKKKLICLQVQIKIFGEITKGGGEDKKYSKFWFVNVNSGGDLFFQNCRN